MILQQLHNNDGKQSIMMARRQNYNKFKNLVSQRRFQQVNSNQVNKEKDIVIQNLHNCQNEDMMNQFEQLSFYQQKYMILARFLTVWQDKKNKNDKMDPNQVNKIIQIFNERFDPQKQQQNIVSNNKLFKKPDSFNINADNNQFSFNNKPKQPIAFTQSPLVMQSNISPNTGLSSAIFQFFQKKQRELKNVGFRDLIDKRANTSNLLSSKFVKKSMKPMHDLEVKKLLEENRRLHSQLEKKSKQESQLNQFEKNVLRQQKQRCMKRIQQLEDEVQQLARNNYKLQQIQRSKKAVTTFVNQDSVQSQRSQLYPYFIQTRHNDLKLLTQKNKINFDSNQNKDNILLNLVNEIPPIQKKEQYSFDQQFQQLGDKMGKAKKTINENNVLEGLLEQDDNFNINQANLKDQGKVTKSAFKGPQQSIKIDKKLFSGGQQINSNDLMSNRNKLNQIQNGNNFDSFSLANTAYNNSSLFLNASKNQIAINSVTSTRNKVAFFKNSLVICKDQFVQIAFKKSDMGQSYSLIRLIFYVNNKTPNNEVVRIQYDYEAAYYNFKIKQKLINIGSFQQGRQVIQIKLSDNCSDINSVVDVHFTIGQRKYDLWVPICFIEWTKDPLIQAAQMGFLTIQPDRQFANYENISKILPISKKSIKSYDQIQAYLFGRSKFGNHQVKLTWWQKQLTIDANNKILDFLGFVMHHFK